MKIKLKPLIALLVILAVAFIGFTYNRFFVYTSKDAQYKVFINQVPDRVYQSPRQTLEVKVHKPLDGLEYVTWLDVQVKPEAKELVTKNAWADTPNEACLSLDASLTPAFSDYQQLAAQILKGEADPVASVPMVMDWLHENVKLEGGRVQEWVMAPGEDYLDDRMLFGIDALSAEYATVFSGVMRAQGIPTRTVGGHIYMDDHYALTIWNEIWIEGEGWKTVDVRNQRVGADNRYIRFYTAPDYTGFIEQLAALRFGVERTNW